MRTHAIAPEREPRSVLGDILIAMRDGLARACAGRSANQAIAHMEGLPDYLLRDLGLQRSEIRNIVRSPADRTPYVSRLAS